MGAGTRRVTRCSPGGFCGRNLLVAGQVAISRLLLLTTTGVLYAGVYKSFVNSFKNPGFQVDHLLAVSFDSPKIHSRKLAPLNSSTTWWND